MNRVAQPVTTQILVMPGLVPLVMMSNTLVNGLATGILLLLLLLVSHITVIPLRRLISRDTRPLCLLLICATWLTVLDLLLKAYLFPLSPALGVYLSLLAANTLLLWLLETGSIRGEPLRASLAYGLAAALVCLLTGAGRELLAQGTLAGLSMIPRPEAGGYRLFALFDGPVGAWWLLALLLAVVQWYTLPKTDAVREGASAGKGSS